MAGRLHCLHSTGCPMSLWTSDLTYIGSCSWSRSTIVDQRRPASGRTAQAWAYARWDRRKQGFPNLCPVEKADLAGHLGIVSSLVLHSYSWSALTYCHLQWLWDGEQFENDWRTETVRPSTGLCRLSRWLSSACSPKDLAM